MGRYCMTVKGLKSGLGLVALTVFLLATGVKEGRAQSCCRCINMINTVDYPQWFSGSDSTVEVVNNHLDAEFNALETWMISDLFEDNILPAMMLMTQQLTVVAMSQVQIFGSFLDAKHQLETQRLFQRLQAQAHKDYHPSVGMCEFGSAVKSLAASERKSEITALTLGQRSIGRQLGSPNTSAVYGPGLDKEGRLLQFRGVYCNPRDHNNGLWEMCRGTSPVTGASGESALRRQRYNKDIDYARTVDFPWTLDVDFTDTPVAGPGGTANLQLTQDERHVFALASNLYAHDVFVRPDAADLAPPGDGSIKAGLTDIQKAYMDVRSLVAKRSVAEASFNAIVGMKSAGTAGSRDYLVAMLVDLGIVDPAAPGDQAAAEAEILRLLGENPSYYAQMGVMTKKWLQNPNFYTNLIDKPANVQRKGVALQAIGLMQKFDMLKSYLRSEASLSVLLELAVMDLQDDVENEMNVVDGSGVILPAP